jgi:hypothetical protein
MLSALRRAYIPVFIARVGSDQKIRLSLVGLRKERKTRKKVATQEDTAAA